MPIIDRLASIKFAVRGIATMARAEPNAWIHAGATVAAIGVGLLSHLSRIEWGLLVIAIVAVWTAEAFNTALELLTDLVSPGRHPLAGQAKDVAAGAVLLTAIGAVAVGALVIGPHALAWMSLGGP
jgi:diacylglycerol kinase